MDSFIKADIFFAVTAVAVFAVSAIAIWALIYLVKILHNVEDISETVKKETKQFSRDLDNFRNRVGKKGAMPNFIMRWIGRSGTKKNKNNHS